MRKMLHVVLTGIPIDGDMPLKRKNAIFGTTDSEQRLYPCVDYPLSNTKLFFSYPSYHEKQFHIHFCLTLLPHMTPIYLYAITRIYAIPSHLFLQWVYFHVMIFRVVWLKYTLTDIFGIIYGYSTVARSFFNSSVDTQI